MSNRSLVILGIMAAFSLAGAIIVAGLGQGAGSSVGVRPLVQGLDPAEIARIVLDTPEGEPVTLVRQGEGFAVAEKGGYPAETGRINDLLRQVLEIETAEKITDNPENFAELGVTEESARTVVKLYRGGGENEPNELITGVVVGKSPEEGPGAYVRLANRNEVYFATEAPWIQSRATDYIETRLLSLEREDISAVHVQTPGGGYGLAADPNGTVRLMEPAVAGQVKTSELSAVFAAATNLYVNDVLPASEVAAMPFGYTYTVKLKDSTMYTLDLGQDKDKYYLKAEAKFLKGDRVTVSQGESQEQLQAKAQLLEAAEAGQRFSERHQGWVYQIGKHQYDRMTKSLGDLVEASEPAVQGDSAAAESAQQVD